MNQVCQILNKNSFYLEWFCTQENLAPNPSSQSSGYRYPIEHSTVFQSLSSDEFNEAKICDKNPQFWRTKPQWFYSRKNPQRSLPKSEIALSIRTLSTQSQKLDQQKWLCVVVDGWWEVEDEENSCVYLSLFLVVGKTEAKTIFISHSHDVTA